MDRQPARMTDRQGDKRWTDSMTDRHGDGLSGLQTARHDDAQTGRQTDVMTGRQTDMMRRHSSVIRVAVQ